MKAIILAAGRGSRMKHQLMSGQCLIEFNEKPLLEWQLEAIRAAGIDEIGIVTGYKREMLTKYGLVEFHNQSGQRHNSHRFVVLTNGWRQILHSKLL